MNSFFLLSEGHEMPEKSGLTLAIIKGHHIPEEPLLTLVMKHFESVLHEFLLGQAHRFGGDEVQIDCLTRGHSGFLEGLIVRWDTLSNDPFLYLHRKTVLQAHLFIERNFVQKQMII